MLGLARQYGGRTWARTKDPLIKSQLLYQLSYASIPGSVRGALEAPPLRGGRRLASVTFVANPFLPKPEKSPYQRTVCRFWRSIDIRMPMHSITDICADPPKLISGSGTPTTGARPITIAMLIAT
jgi:hypothetical protein